MKAFDGALERRSISEMNYLSDILVILTVSMFSCFPRASLAESFTDTKLELYESRIKGHPHLPHISSYVEGPVQSVSIHVTSKGPDGYRKSWRRREYNPDGSLKSYHSKPRGVPFRTDYIYSSDGELAERIRSREGVVDRRFHYEKEYLNEHDYLVTVTNVDTGKVHYSEEVSYDSEEKTIHSIVTNMYDSKTKYSYLYDDSGLVREVREVSLKGVFSDTTRSYIDYDEQGRIIGYKHLLNGDGKELIRYVFRYSDAGLSEVDYYYSGEQTPEAIKTFTNHDQYGNWMESVRRSTESGEMTSQVRREITYFD